MSMKELIAMIFGCLMGMLIVVLGYGFVFNNDIVMDNCTKTTVYQPEYNHRVDEDIATIVSDTTQIKIYCILYKNKLFVPSTTDLNTKQ